MGKRGTKPSEITLLALTLAVDDNAWIDAADRSQTSRIRSAFRRAGMKLMARRLNKGGWRLWRVR
jgi:hypothetical protein